MAIGISAWSRGLSVSANERWAVVSALKARTSGFFDAPSSVGQERPLRSGDSTTAPWGSPDPRVAFRTKRVSRTRLSASERVGCHATWRVT